MIFIISESVPEGADNEPEAKYLKCTLAKFRDNILEGIRFSVDDDAICSQQHNVLRQVALI